LPFFSAHDKYIQLMLARCVLLVGLVASTTFALPEQPTSVVAGAKPDYSQEAAVVEEMATKIVFENSGNFNREQASRVRVLTDAGVKDWGLLSFPYQSATQTVEVEYVRVRKPDGSTIVSPPDNFQDMDSEITRAAPFYSDLREKHVAVKGLGKGDTVEYAVHWQATKPLVPGQFWFEYNFLHHGVVVNERLEIRVPADRSVKVKGPATQSVSNEMGARVYTWTYSRLQNNSEPAEEQKKAVEAARGRSPPPDVQLSSFQSWDEVGRWYWGLQRDRIEPSAAVRAKAAELTKGLSDDDAKLRAIYRFVGMQYRYIGIAFGVGRYQPHAADDVLTNNYGDCKDKHTLFASLLQASGITIFPALISARHTLDEEVPSPAQFDHMIGYLPHGKDALWLDTTPEVAPIGLLLPQLRDKKALVISGEGTARLVTTPEDPPTQGTQRFTIEGNIKDDGTFEAKVEDAIHGENEVYLREAFRRIPQAQWKDLAQQISYELGYSGTVSDVTASSPEEVDESFHFAYSYNRKDYPDWSNHRFTVPGLPFAMPPLRDDSKYPVWLGPPLETISKSRIGLPHGYTPQPPPNLDLNYDFAEYRVSYSKEGEVLSATRRLLIKQHEVPLAEFDHYRKFLKDVFDDINQYVPAFSSNALISPGKSATAASPALDPRIAVFVNQIRALPDSPSSEANKLEADARERMSKLDLSGAVSSLYRAVGEDAKFARAWVLLGTLLLSEKQTDAGVDAFHKAMAAAPENSAIPKALGFAFMANANYDAAVPVWRDFIKAHPDDADGPANLGNCLRKLGRNADAAAAYEASLKIKADQLAALMGLGSTYLQAGERQKASSAFQKLAEMDSEKRYLNDAAYEMANNDLDLPLALNYAKQAVQVAEVDSLKVTLQDLKLEDLRKIFRLAAYWDTLGWVNERLSNMEAAEQYLKASWKLDQDGVVAGHLCHLYRREHKIAAAIQMCQMAISRMSMSKQLSLDAYGTELAAARENLSQLTGLSTNSTSSFDTSGRAIAERTFKLPRLVPGTESADFFLLFSSDGKSGTFHVEDVKFISGSDKIKAQARQLRSIAFNVSAPASAHTRFVWRGILGCYQYTGCSFVVLDPASVNTLN
jgi:tetratricopeptide (TPR) repeat protein